MFTCHMIVNVCATYLMLFVSCLFSCIYYICDVFLVCLCTWCLYVMCDFAFKYLRKLRFFLYISWGNVCFHIIHMCDAFMSYSYTWNICCHLFTYVTFVCHIIAYVICEYVALATLKVQHFPLIKIKDKTAFFNFSFLPPPQTLLLSTSISLFVPALVAYKNMANLDTLRSILSILHTYFYNLRKKKCILHLATCEDLLLYCSQFSHFGCYDLD